KIMDKVKIKRVKRNKKKVTTAEKIMAGIGVGSTLMGGAAVGAGKTNQTQFVRTNEASSSSTAQKIKAELKNIFGVGEAEAAGLSVADAQAQVTAAQAALDQANQALTQAQATQTSAAEQISPARQALGQADQAVEAAQAAF